MKGNNISKNNVPKKNIQLEIRVVVKLYSDKRYSDIIKLINRFSSEKESLETDYLYYYLLALINLEQYVQSLEILSIFDRREVSNRQNYQLKMLRGYIYSKLSRLDDARNEFLSIQKIGYNTVDLLGALGHVTLMLGEQEIAKEYLEEALKIDPNHISVLNSMSYLLAKYDIDISLATEYITKVLIEDPKNPAYLDTYGYILFKLGELKEAEKILTSAYDLGQDNLILEHLIEVKQAMFVD